MIPYLLVDCLYLVRLHGCKARWCKVAKTGVGWAMSASGSCSKGQICGKGTRKRITPKLFQEVISIPLEMVGSAHVHCGFLLGSAGPFAPSVPEMNVARIGRWLGHLSLYSSHIMTVKEAWKPGRCTFLAHSLIAITNSPAPSDRTVSYIKNQGQKMVTWAPAAPFDHFTI